MKTELIEKFYCYSMPHMKIPAINLEGNGHHPIFRYTAMLIKIYFQRFNWQINNSLGNGLSPTGCQAIIWTNVDRCLSPYGTTGHNWQINNSLGNGLSPTGCQAIIWTNVDRCLSPYGTTGHNWQINNSLGYGLSPTGCQAIIWTNVDRCLSPYGTTGHNKSKDNVTKN